LLMQPIVGEQHRAVDRDVMDKKLCLSKKKFKDSFRTPASLNCSNLLVSTGSSKHKNFIAQ